MPTGYAARVTDMTAHGMPAAPGIGSANVMIGMLPAWRTNLDTCACPVPIAPPAPAPHGPEICLMGSTTVLINFQMACRVGDILQGAGPPNSFTLGCVTVTIGDLGFGMANPAAIAAYSRAMRAVFDHWNEMSEAERLAAMEAAINASLPPGMPPLRLNPTSMGASTYGQLSFRTWNIDINRNLLSGEMTRERFAQLTDTIYHEGRHGEQWFNAAQYRASQGESAPDIASQTGMPQRVGEAACQNPAGPGSSQGAMGQSVNNSVYGDQGDYRDNVLNNMSTSGNYQRYRALPEEQDAWAQGGAARNAFNATGS